MAINDYKCLDIDLTLKDDVMNKKSQSGINHGLFSQTAKIIF